MNKIRLNKLIEADEGSVLGSRKRLAQQIFQGIVLCQILNRLATVRFPPCANVMEVPVTSLRVNEQILLG